MFSAKVSGLNFSNINCSSCVLAGAKYALLNLLKGIHDRDMVKNLTLQPQQPP